jgi:hypothetical protein
MFSRAATISGPLFCAILSWATTACGGGDLVLPGDGAPTSLRAVGGDGQQGTVGTKLPDPLVVRVVDAAAHPVPDVLVRFESDVPDAEIKPAVAATNDSGYAAVEVRLGSTEGLQVIDALLDISAAAGPRTAFQLTALAPPPDDRGRERDEGDDDDNDEDEGGRGNGHDDDEEDEKEED